MEEVEVERVGAVEVVRLARGATNALGSRLVDELAARLRRSGNDPAVHGLVLSSASERFFSIGFDLPSLVPLPREEFARFFAAFDDLCLVLLTVPKPVVAAVTGHAIAGGCILALCCDYRFLAEGRKLMGLNEIKLGVPVPFLAGRVLARLAGERVARDMCDSGEFYPPQALLEMGVADRLLPPDQLLDEAVRMAATLGGAPGDAFAGIKRDRLGSLIAEIKASLQERQRSFTDSWYAPAARERLNMALEKFEPRQAR
jgi:enoyl-CoA hydratase/carnithine racemase